MVLYAFAILAVFLCLAALYESWTIPLAVILVVPLGVLGVLLATLLRGYANDVYFQVGLITIIGLSAKNAILIIEFAKDLQAQGKGLVEAALAAAHLRFRPIIMTSLAFTLGVLPLALASGRRLGQPARHRHRRDRRHDHRHRAGGGLRAGVLRGGAHAVQGQRAPAPRDAEPSSRPMGVHMTKELNPMIMNIQPLACWPPRRPCWPAAPVMPTHERPAAPVPAAFPGQAAGAGGRRGPPAWRLRGRRPPARADRALALQNNRDLRVAALNIEQVRAQYQIRRADQAAHAQPGRHRQPPAQRQGGISSTYTAGLAMASWELDFFGRVASLKEAALAQYLASEEARNAAQTSLVASVASTWLALQADDELLALTHAHPGHARGFAAPDEAALRQRRRLGAGPAPGRIAGRRGPRHAGPAAAPARAGPQRPGLLVGQSPRRPPTCPPAERKC
jgi:hypothetical protein